MTLDPNAPGIDHAAHLNDDTADLHDLLAEELGEEKARTVMLRIRAAFGGGKIHITHVKYALYPMQQKKAEEMLAAGRRPLEVARHTNLPLDHVRRVQRRMR